jgi:hypothetical protein
LDSEILNGGIRQVFWNHSNWQLDEMLAAVDAIGATETASHLRKAIEVFQTGDIPESRSAFWGEDDRFHAEPTLNAIDESRCSDEASAHDWTLLVSYMRQHPDQFVHG